MFIRSYCGFIFHPHKTRQKCSHSKAGNRDVTILQLPIRSHGRSGSSQHRTKTRCSDLANGLWLTKLPWIEPYKQANWCLLWLLRCNRSLGSSMVYGTSRTERSSIHFRLIGVRNCHHGQASTDVTLFVAGWHCVCIAVRA